MQAHISPSSGQYLISFKIICSAIPMAFLFIILIPYGCISGARIASSIHNYSAPLTLYNHLYSKELGMNSTKDVKICVGKEWYRFGSSFFIPSKYQHLVFIKSGFDGLLPQVDLFFFVDSLAIR